jgi:ABC-2 type transport system ATP-binding protein
MNDPVIQVQGLDKSYGKVQALTDLSLTVERGEVHGFLGPNGAGKTTAIRILLGLLRADSGTAAVFGDDPWDQAVSLHRRLAYVPGEVELWPNLSGGQAIDVLGKLRGGVDRTRVEHVAKRFDLDLTKKGRTYSKGNRQKVALVAALAADAELLILDEPTAGLDPLMEAVFQSMIHEARDEGRTVLLSSHILAQVEVLADRVSIIRQGHIVETGTLTDLQHLARTSITAHVANPADDVVTMDGVHAFEQDEDRVHFEVETAHLDAVLRRLATLHVRSLVSRPPTLEQLLLRHYSDTDSNVSAS